MSIMTNKKAIIKNKKKYRLRRKSTMTKINTDKNKKTSEVGNGDKNRGYLQKHL